MNGSSTSQSSRVAASPVENIFLNRWSPRSFDNTAISHEQLLGLLEAARWAPSGLNVQPWRFVYALRGEATWNKLTASLWPLNQLWAPKAAALIVVTTQTLFTPPNASDPVPNPSHAFDAGAAWAHLALQATASGWAAHAMGGFDHAAVAEVINLPVNHATHVIVAIGKQGSGAELPESMQAREFPSSRRPISESVVRGAFPII